MYDLTNCIVLVYANMYDLTSFVVLACTNI